MASLLIVDDENAIIEDVKMTLSTENTGIDRIYQANTGTQAIEILNSHTVNVVITDIRLPGMDGIELVRTIRENWKKIKCILLSGYAEFTYAQEAIRQDVVDYLLKPVMDQKLLSTIRATVQMICEEQKEQQFHSKVENAFNENISSLQQTLLNELLDGKVYEEQRLKDKLELYKIPDVTDEPYALMVAGYEEDRKWDRESLLEFAVSNIAGEIFKHFYLWSTTKNHQIVTLIFLKPEVRHNNTHLMDEELSFGKIVERLAVQLQDNVKFYLNLKLSFSLGVSGRFPRNLPAVYRKEVAHFETRHGHHGQLKQRNGDAPDIQPLAVLLDSPTLMQLLEEGKWDAIDGKLTTIFGDLKQNPSYSKDQVLEVYFIIANTLFYFLHRNGNYLSDVLSENAEDFLRRLPFFTVEHFEKWTYGMVSRIRELMRGQRKRNHVSVIQKVQDYISRHIATDVSLQTIADHVRLHPVYLSKLFKYETGEGLSEYVQRVRLEKAAYMLIHADERIYEISLNVGLLDPSYFIRVFKKYFGMTPQQYRDQSRAWRNLDSESELVP